MKDCLKDRNFYDGKINDPKLWSITSAEQIEQQMPALVPVITALHDEGVHVAVETCLFVPSHNLELALNHIDFFYVDVKLLSPTLCKEVEKGNFELYLTNLQTLLAWRDEERRGKPVVIRIPLIGGYTDSNDNRVLVHKLLEQYRNAILKIEIIKEHNLGESKYRSLITAGADIAMSEYKGVDDSLMDQYKEELDDLGIMTEICKI